MRTRGIASALIQVSLGASSKCYWETKLPRHIPSMVSPAVYTKFWPYNSRQIPGEPCFANNGLNM